MKILILLTLFIFNFLLANEKQFDNVNVYGVIICGGSGKRLWPLSRKNTPKQFIPLIGNQSLLINTVERIENLVSKSCLYAITNKNYVEKIKKQTEKVNLILEEPSARGTAAAIIFSALKIYEKDPNAILFFVPADHYIPDIKAFNDTMQCAIDYAKLHDQIVLLGIKPIFPSIEYGYIEYKLSHNNNLQKVLKFHEKPKKDIANKYIQSGNFLWNAGIFCAQANVFLKECAQHSPEILNQVKEYIYNQRSYENITEESFDIAVLEKSLNCSVLPANFEWSDVGSLEQFLTIKKNNSNSNDIIEYKAKGNIVDGSKKLKVLFNVDNLCVIETDDIIFIAPKTETNGIRKVIDYLEVNGYEKYI